MGGTDWLSVAIIVMLTIGVWFWWWQYRKAARLTEETARENVRLTENNKELLAALMLKEAEDEDSTHA